jgi:hypothetical protein
MRFLFILSGLYLGTAACNDLDIALVAPFIALQRRRSLFEE